MTPILKVFVSSPGDVAEERALSERVLTRLAGEFADRVEIRPVFWEHEPLLASGTFQEQIVRPSDTDIVICILWSRLGTRLPARFRRADGTRYASGTEFEFEDALAGHRARGSPDLLVYRKTAEPMVSLLDSALLMDKLDQRRALDAFVSKWFHDAEDGSLRAAFHPFSDPGEFEGAVERHLRALILRRHPGPPTHRRGPGTGGPRQATWRKGSPFRGLEPFDLEHADVFFGRTRAVSEALEHLRRQAAMDRPFLVVVGASGSGKSSLARAGLLPLLVRPGVMEGVAGWRTAVMRPSGEGGDPFLALAEALSRDSALPMIPGEAGGVSGIASMARHDPAHLAHRVRGELDASGARIGLVLLVDQLEELFSLRGIGEVDRQAFGSALAHLVAQGGVWVVTTLRSDLYPRLAEIPQLVELKEGHGQYDLMPPTASEIGDMIRQPTLAAGLCLEEDPDSGERLEDLLVDAAAGSPDLLPLLEFTLEELYRERRDDGTLTLAAFRELGGVEGSLARRAEQVLTGLPGEVQDALPALMRSLVNPLDSPDGGAMGAHPAPLDQLGKEPAMAHLVGALVEARLLVTDLDADGSAVVRITHEALLRHWPRVALWLEADREALKARARLRAAAFRWAEENRNPDLLLSKGKPLEDARAAASERGNLSELERDFLGRSEWRAKRSLRLRVLAGVALVLLAAIAAGSGWAARESADSARAEALAARRTHEFMVGLLATARPDLAQGGMLTAVDLLDLGGRRLLDGEMADVPGSRAWALRELAITYLRLGRVEPALALARAADSLSAREPSIPDSARAEGWLLLGDIHAESNQLDSAAAHFERARGIWASRSPPLASAVASRLAGVRRLEGRNEEYRDLMEEHFREALRGPDDGELERAAVLTNRAIYLREQGQVLEAERLLLEAEAIWARHPGVRPSQRAEFLVILANNVADQARAPEADSIYRQALAIQRRIQPDHPSLGFTLTGLGLVAWTLGNAAEAERWLREALRHFSATLGERHLQTANARVNLSELLAREGEWTDEAGSLLEQAVHDLEEEAPRSPVLTTALQNLAALRSSEGDLDAMRSLYDRAAALDSASGRWGHAVQALARLAEREQGAGREEQALTASARALALSASIPDPLARARALDDLQDRFMRSDLYPTSEEAAREALRLREDFADGTPALARSLAEVAWWDAVRHAGDPKMEAVAEERLQRAVRLLLDRQEDDDPESFRAEQAVSETLMLLGRHLEVAAREENLTRRLSGTQRPLLLVESLVRQGFAFRSAGIEDRARAAFRRALDEAERGLGSGHPMTHELRALVEEGSTGP